MNILQQIQQENIKRELANRLNFEKAEQNSLISQIQDDVLKGMSEEEILEKNRNGGYNDLQKGKSMPIGTISNGYKKIADGKWRKVSEHGMTKEEHESEKKVHQKVEENQGNEVSDRRKAQDEQNKHNSAASKLDSKDYSDEEVGLGKKQGDGNKVEKQMFDVGHKVKFFDNGRNKDFTGKITNFKEKDGKIFYDIKIDGRTDISENVKQSDIGIKKSQVNDLEKARAGKYDDTPENRKLGRVGQQYGSKKKEEETGGEKKEEKISRGEAKSAAKDQGVLIMDNKFYSRSGKEMEPKRSNGRIFFTNIETQKSQPESTLSKSE